MFNRYWRSYPWALRLALALLLVFTLISFTTYLILILGPKLSGLQYRDLIKITERSPAATIRTSMLTQGFASIGQYLLPAVLFAVFCHPRPRAYLGIRKPGKSLHWIIVTLIVVGLVPAQLVAETWMMDVVKLGADADKEQAASTQLVKAWMSLRGGGSLALILTVLALIPAIGEELLFRGVLLRLFHQFFSRRRTILPQFDSVDVQPDIQRSMLMPILVTTVMFTAMHSGPYGFVFIFIAGCVLALIYQLTGSLVTSIWAHFVYNGSQVLLSYFSASGTDIDVPAWVGLAGLGVFLLSFYALIRNQTPLAANWSADFAPGEEPPQQA